MTRLTTRSIRTAEHIRDRKEFTTSGSLRAEVDPYLSAWSSGQLSGLDLDWFRHDLALIDYVVWSYSTPIAWHMTCSGSFNVSESRCDMCNESPEAHDDGGVRAWHRVGQSFSPTTGKHQSNLYLIDRENHEVRITLLSSYRSDEPGSDKWGVNCTTCGGEVSRHVYKKEANESCHTHRISGRTGLHPVNA